jgi:rod shape-determining protein MreC
MMDYVAGSDLLEPGEEVVTSGLGGVFPKGLPVGLITSVTPDPVTHVKTATVLPYTDFANLEEVSVLLPAAGGEPSE